MATGDYEDPSIKEGLPMLAANPMSDRVPMILEGEQGYAVQPVSSLEERDALRANETDTAEAVVANTGRRTDRGTLIARVVDLSSQHGDDDTGTGMPNMSEDGESLALTTRADRYAVFGDLGDGELVPAVPFDPKPDGPRYAAMGDAVTVNVIEWIGLRIMAAACTQ